MPSNAPRWARRLLGRLAGPERADEILGDLEEAHRRRLARRSPALAHLLTALETLDMARALLRERRRGRAPWLGVSSLDVKLGLRMMLKHPAITVLGTLAIAFAVFVGAGAFEFISQVAYPRLPLPHGDRIVGLRLWDASRSRTESRALYDLATWRRQMTTVEELGAYRTVERNLVTLDGRGEPLATAEMDAVGFRVAGIPPLLGRPLVDDDQRPGAAPVVVIGHDVWTSRFAGDPDVVGASVELDGTPTTVVGVMPEGFGFPVSHQAWTPSRMDGMARAPLEGPGVSVFGRLAAGTSLEDARAELAVVGDRLAAAFPATHEHLRPQVIAWPRAVMGLSLVGVSPSTILVTALGLASNLPLVLFLILVCGNVGLLMFARAASRESELVVRSALGASRRRIVVQLFVEALLLSAVGALIGLAVAQYALRWVLRITETVVLEGNPLPFWFHASLSPATLLYAGLLSVLAAMVAGVIPGLKVTRGLGRQLQRTTAGGGGFRFGGVWTAVIVCQIAVTMIFPLLAYAARVEGHRELAEDLDVPGTRYLSARIEMSRPPAGATAGETPEETEAWLRTRWAPTVRRLQERLEAEPRVAGVTFTERLPREYHPWRQVEVDGPMAEPRDERGHRLGASTVAVNYFDVMGARIVAGRGFRPADVGEEPGVVVVNESFVRSVLGGRNAVGQRVRYLGTEAYRSPDQDPGPWHEIVGVVEDRGTLSGYGPQGMYHPAAPDRIQPVHVVLRASGDAHTLAPVLRSVAVEVDPALRLHDVMTLDQVTQGQREFFAFWTTVLVTVSALALLLSLGGIFAVMSYAVSRRTREIGIRVALGSSRARVLGAVFRRPLAQLASGVLAGGTVIAVTAAVADAPRVTWPDGRTLTFIATYMLATAAVCLIACVVPTARALSVEPSEALREE